MKKKMSLPMQILIALVAGIAVGLVCYFGGFADITTNYLKPFGDIFVNLLKFIVVPVVASSPCWTPPAPNTRPRSSAALCPPW